jgi:hypothetical protein
MATLALQPCRLAYCEDGSAGLYQKMVNNSTSVIDGELGVLTNDGFTTCGTNPSVITHLALAASAAVGTLTIPGDTTAYQTFLRIRNRVDVFEMSLCYGATASSSAVIAASDLDAQADFGITKATVDGVTAWCVDIDKAGANQICTVIKALGTYGDVYQRVLVKFLATSSGAL